MVIPPLRFVYSQKRVLAVLKIIHSVFQKRFSKKTVRMNTYPNLKQQQNYQDNKLCRFCQYSHRKSSLLLLGILFIPQHENGPTASLSACHISCATYHVSCLFFHRTIHIFQTHKLLEMGFAIAAHLTEKRKINKRLIFFQIYNLFAIICVWFSLMMML